MHETKVKKAQRRDLRWSAILALLAIASLYYFLPPRLTARQIRFASTAAALFALFPFPNYAGAVNIRSSGVHGMLTLIRTAHDPDAYMHGIMIHECLLQSLEMLPARGFKPFCDIVSSLLESVLNRSIPTTNPIHLKLWWSIQVMESPHPEVAFSFSAIKHACGSEDVDPLAVWARTMLISTLARDGWLEEYRHDGSFEDTVFDVASQFPLPRGLVFDKEEFLAKLS